VSTTHYSEKVSRCAKTKKKERALANAGELKQNPNPTKMTASFLNPRLGGHENAVGVNVLKSEKKTRGMIDRAAAGTYSYDENKEEISVEGKRRDPAAT